MIKYTPKEIIQGEAIKREKEETAQTFHGEKSRMAGDVGEFAMKMMNDPVSIKQNQMWMDAFNMSNEGFQFNQAKMMMMGGNKPQEHGA